MKKQLFLFLLCYTLFLKFSNAQQITLVNSLSGSNIGQYEKIEIGVGLSTAFSNPYDPDIVSLEADFVSPTGQHTTVYGFFYVPFTVDDTKNGCNGTTGYAQHWTTVGWNFYPWRVRFSPTQNGLWSYTIKLFVNGSSSPISTFATQTFNCIASSNNGFLRVSGNKRYLEHSNGTSFFGIGENITHWPGTDVVKALTTNIVGSGCSGSADFQDLISAPCTEWNHSTYAYLRMTEMMGQLAEAGGNFQRLWLTPDGYDPEWEVLGNYGARQHRMFELDNIVDFAKSKGIYLQLMLLHSSRFEHCNKDIFGWQQNPYRSISGVSNEIDFFTNTNAIKKYKQRLRYIIARWGYSTNIGMYELSNELDFMNDGGKIYSGACPNPTFVANWWDNAYKMPVNNWHSIMAAYIKSIDKNHPIMYSNAIAQVFDQPTSSTNSAPIASDPNIDILDFHQYGHDYNIGYQKSFVQNKYLSKYNKPINIGETGFNGGGICSVQDPENTLFHNELWYSAFSGSFSTGLYYFVGSEHHHPKWGVPFKKYYHFLPLQKTMSGLVFNDPNNPFEPIGNNYSAFLSYSPNKYGTTRTNDAPIIDMSGFSTCNWFSGENDPPNTNYMSKGVSTTNDKKIEVYALKKDNLIVGWVHLKDNYFYNTNCSPVGTSMAIGCSPPYPNTPNPMPCTLFKNSPQLIPTLTNQSLTISNLKCNGRYRVEWWSCYYEYGDNNNDGVGNDNGGKIVAFTSYQYSSNGTLIVPIPKLQAKGTAPYAPDYGFKIFYESSNVAYTEGKWIHDYPGGEGQSVWNKVAPEGDIETNSVGNHVFFKCALGKLAHYWWNGTGWVFSVTGNTSVTVDGDIAIDENNNPLFRGNDGWIHRFTSSNNVWQEQIVGGAGQATWKQIAQGSKIIAKGGHIFYHTNSGQMMHYWWNGSGYSHEPTGNYGVNTNHFVSGDKTFDENMNVIYRAADGWIHRFYPNNGWKNEIVGGIGQDLTRRIASDSKIITNNGHIFYKSISGQMMHYWWNGSSYSHEKTGNYGAVPNDFVSGDMAFNASGEVVYRAADEWIHRFYFDNGWKNNIIVGASVGGLYGITKCAAKSKMLLCPDNVFYESGIGPYMYYIGNGSNYHLEFTESGSQIPNHFNDGASKMSSNKTLFYRGADGYMQSFYFSGYNCFQTSGKTDESNVINIPSEEYPQVEEEYIKCFPNPFEDKLNISYSIKSNDENVIVRIIDVRGQLIEESKYPNEKQGVIPYSNTKLQQGVYIVELITSDKRLVQKIVSVR